MILLDLACEICYYVRQRGEEVFWASGVSRCPCLNDSMVLRNYLSNLNIERSMDESE